MRITIEGPAAAADASDEEIVDVERLRSLDGVKSEATCVDYLDEPLAEIGLIGGHVEFTFDEPSGRLRVRTVYHSPRKLKEKELDQLVEETRGQWSDGIGEGDLSGRPRRSISSRIPCSSQVSTWTTSRSSRSTTA